MANERATNEQLEERHELAASLLADGIPHHKVVQQLAVAYKVSPQQARDYVREAKKLVLHQFDESDIKFEILQCLDDLKQDRLDARAAGNYSAAVGATKARVKLFDIFPNELNDYYVQECKDHIHEKLNPPKGKIPRESIMKKTWERVGKDLDLLDYGRDEIPF